MPTANTLTDAACRKAPLGKSFDGHGLYLHVTATAKTWRMAYRIAGKPQTATFGPYPLITLAEARVKRDDLRRKLLDGVDPRPAAPSKAVPTFSEGVVAYWEGRRDISPSYRQNVVRGLAMHIEPDIGGMQVNAIKREDLLKPLNRMDAAGLHVYVRKARVWASQVFDWAVEQGHRTDNPAAGIRTEKAFGRATVKNHAALELTEVPDFLGRLAVEGELQSVLACRLLALTWVRTIELRMMLWSEIEGDLWRIPEGKMKRRRDHLVPLSKQAVAILAKLRERSSSDYVFPNDRDKTRPMSENAVLYLIGRIGYQGKMTGHGFRAVGSTWANERGYNPDAIERQLAHAADDKTRAAYNRAAYLAERKSMLQAWANWLDDVDPSRAKGGKTPA